jgi:ArsR family transcriptional regulator
MIDPLQFYKSLADEIRLKSLLLIQLEGEVCVCELMAALDEPQPKISRHLALLREDKILLDRRQGQWVYYRLNPALPDWAKTVIAHTAETNRPFIQPHHKNLCRMGNRPERQTSCC